MLVNLIYYMLRTNLYAPSHVGTLYLCIILVLTSRSLLLKKKKSTLSFNFLIKHFLCCSLHFFRDVCITKYKQGVKGGMSPILTCFLPEYWKYNPINVFILFYFIIFCISFKAAGIDFCINAHLPIEKLTASMTNLYMCCMMYACVYVYDIIGETVGSAAN